MPYVLLVPVVTAAAVVLLPFSPTCTSLARQHGRSRLRYPSSWSGWSICPPFLFRVLPILRAVCLQVIFTEDMAEDPMGTLEDVFGFLGLDLLDPDELQVKPPVPCPAHQKCRPRRREVVLTVRIGAYFCVCDERHVVNLRAVLDEMLDDVRPVTTPGPWASFGLRLHSATAFVPSVEALIFSTDAPLCPTQIQ